MRLLAIALVMLAVAAFDVRRGAEAQPYCARYDEGSRECGIPTLAACEQSLRGLNGVCEPDMQSQRAPDLIQLPRLFQPSSPPAPDNLPLNSTDPNNPNWVPPPPGQ